MSHIYDKLNGLNNEQKYKFLVKRNKENKLPENIDWLLNSDKVTDKLDFLLQTLKFFEEGEVVNSVVRDVTNLLTAYLSTCVISELEAVLEWFVQQIRKEDLNSCKSVEIFGKCLSRVVSLKNVLYEGEVFPGVEGYNCYLNKLCTLKWSKAYVLPFVEMLRDLVLDAKQLDTVTDKIINTLSYILVTDIPQVVYQLLLFATKGKHRSVITGIVAKFHELEQTISEREDSLLTDNVVSEELVQVEGTAILHITTAIKHDIELGKAIIWHMKNVRNFTCLSLGLGVALLSHHRFTEQVKTILKSAIQKNLKSRSLITQSMILGDIITKPDDINDTFEAIVSRKDGGWDLLTEGLVKLAFVLLDSPDVADVSIANVGINILEKCYKIHPHCKSTVLNQVLNRIVSASQLPSNKHKKLLYSISRRSLQLMLTETRVLKDNLPNIPQIPVSNAEAVLSAIVPVMRYDAPLRDYGIMVFRKSLFSKDPNTRMIAVIGLTEMVKKFRVGEAYSQSSQLSCSQIQVHMMATNDINEAVCTELIMLLKRALKQQSAIRSKVYDRLADIISSNPQIYPMILQLLEEQLDIIYEKDENLLPPIKLSECITTLPDQSILKEPIPNLLQAIFQCTQGVNEWVGDEEDEVLKLTEKLSSILMRCCKSDLEDWELDKAVQFGSTGVESRNLVTAQTLISILEVLLEHVIVNARGLLEEAESFKKVFYILNNVMELLTEKQASSRGKKFKPQPSFFSLEAMDRLLEYIFNDDKSEHEDFCLTLRTTTHVSTWTLSVLSESLKSIVANHCEFTSKDMSRTLGNVCKSIIKNLSNFGSLYREKYSGLLLKIVQIIKNLYADKFDEFQKSSRINKDDSFSSQIFTFLTRSTEEENYDETQNYLNIIFITDSKFPNLMSWINESIKAGGLSSALAKDTFGLLLAYNRENDKNLDILSAISEDIHSCMGDIEDEDYSLNHQVTYQLITENNAPRILHVQALAIDKFLSDIEWGIQMGCTEDQADVISIKLSKIATILVPLLQSQTPRGSSVIDQVGRTVKNFYNTFTAFIKHETAKISERDTLRSLEKLSKVVGKQLNDSLYKFMIYIETNDEETGRKRAQVVIRKQVIALPSIIFALEQCERNLITLSKKANSVDFMEHFKRSTARDFRIKGELLKDDVGDENADENSSKQRKKKQKLK